jgi:hypothetical protein
MMKRDSNVSLTIQFNTKIMFYSQLNQTIVIEEDYSVHPGVVLSSQGRDSSIIKHYS